MVDAESKAFAKMPKEARLEFIKLLDPILDTLDLLSGLGFQDPYEGWDYTGSLTDAMAEMYHKGVADGYEQCNARWVETVNDSEFVSAILQGSDIILVDKNGVTTQENSNEK